VARLGDGPAARSTPSPRCCRRTSITSTGPVDALATSLGGSGPQPVPRSRRWPRDRPPGHTLHYPVAAVPSWPAEPRRSCRSATACALAVTIATRAVRLSRAGPAEEADFSPSRQLARACGSSNGAREKIPDAGAHPDAPPYFPAGAIEAASFSVRAESCSTSFINTARPAVAAATEAARLDQPALRAAFETSFQTCANRHRHPAGARQTYSFLTPCTKLPPAANPRISRSGRPVSTSRRRTALVLLGTAPARVQLRDASR